MAAFTSVVGGLGGGLLGAHTKDSKIQSEPLPEYFQTYEEMDGKFDPGYILIGESQTQESSDAPVDHRIYPLMQLTGSANGFVETLSRDSILWESVTGAIRDSAEEPVKGAQYILLKVDIDRHIKGLNE